MFVSPSNGGCKQRAKYIIFWNCSGFILWTTNHARLWIWTTGVRLENIRKCQHLSAFAGMFWKERLTRPSSHPWMFYDSEGRSYVETSHFQRFCCVTGLCLRSAQGRGHLGKLGKDRTMTWLCLLPPRREASSKRCLCCLPDCCRTRRILSSGS